MAIDSGLRQEITELLIALPVLQSREGRQATLLRAGLQEALPHIDLSGSSYEFVARLINLLETYTTLSDGQFALICFLHGISNQLGQNHRDILQAWCQQLHTQLKPRPIAALKSQRPITYLAPFQAPPLPEHFIPRPEVTDALKARLLKDEPTTPGILVVSAIHGLGGIGKSTLAAALAYDKEVQERFPDGILWATLGQQPEILSLISNWIHEMRDYDFRPTTIEAASAHLRTLLQDKAVLLVVDDVWNPEHAVHFKVGGPRCQVLITTRRADVADEVGAELHQMDVMTPEQALDLLAARLQRPLEAAERDEALSLAEAVGYLPLALDLAAVRVARGMSWTALCQALEQEAAHLEALEGSPRRRRKRETTLEASFTLSLNALRTDDEDAWTCFVWLGVLPEDTQITSPMAATLWDVPREEATDILELLWNDALLMPGAPLLAGDEEWPSYRLHDILHDIARKLLTTNKPQGLGLTLQDAHAALLERYKHHTQNNLWHTLPDDGYIHAHLTWHFQQAGQAEQIHALLREETEEGLNGWYQAREQLGQTAGFLEDVNLAMQLAKQNIGLQCRYALIIVSFNSLAKNIPAELLSALVEKGIWKPVQGLAYARQIIDPGQRIETLIDLFLVSNLPEPMKEIILQETLAAAWAMEKLGRHLWARGMVLSRLAPHLSEPLLKEALVTVQTIKKEWPQAEALAGLAIHLPKPLLKKALTTAQRIKNEGHRAMVLKRLAPRLAALGMPEEAWVTAQAIEDKKDRAETLIKLAPHLPESLLWKAVVAAQAIKLDMSFQAEVIARLVAYLPKSLKEDVLRETLAKASQAVNNRWYTSRVLIGLAPHLPESLLQVALTIAQEIKDAPYRAEALAALAPHLSESLLRKALLAVQAMTQMYANSKAEVLTKLAPYLSKPLLREALIIAQAIEYKAKALTGIAPYLSAPLLLEALKTIQAFGYEPQRAEALVNLTPHLPKSLRRTTLQEALATAQTIKDEWHRDKALLEMVPRLIELEAPEEALAAAQAIEKGETQDKALVELVPYLSEPLMHKALAVAQAVKYDWDRAKALAELAPYLTKSLLRKALATAQAIKDDRYRARALVGLAARLAELGDPEEALGVAQTITEARDRARVLAKLVPHLSELLLRRALTTAQVTMDARTRDRVLAGIVHSLIELGTPEEALAAAQTIKDARYSAEVLTKLIPHLPEPLKGDTLQEVLVAAQAVDVVFRAEALTELAPYLPEPLKETALREVLAALQMIKKMWRRYETLAKLAPRLAKLGISERLLVTAEVIPDAELKAKALTELVPYLPGPLKKTALRKALAALQMIEKVWQRYETLAKLAPRLAELGASERLLGVALAVTHAKSKAEVLTSLIPYLPKPLKSHALQEALVATQMIEDTWKQIEALVKLTPHLSETLLWEALATVKAIRYEGARCKALVKLAPHLPEPLLQEALVGTQAIKEEKYRAKALRELAPHLPEPLLQEALAIAQAIENMRHRVEALTGLVSYLPEPLRENVLQEALATALAIGEAIDRAESLVEIAHYLPGLLKNDTLQEALTAAQAIKNKAPWQVAKLGNLALQLIDLGAYREALAMTRSEQMCSRLIDREAFEEALTVVKALGDGKSKVKTLARLSPHLSESLKTNVLREAVIVMKEVRTWNWCDVPVELTTQLIELPSDTLLSLWQQLQEDLIHHTRGNLLADLCSLAPVIAKLGGHEAIIELSHAIQDVGRWWP